MSIFDDFIEMLQDLTGLGRAGDEIEEDRAPGSPGNPGPQLPPITINNLGPPPEGPGPTPLNQYGRFDPDRPTHTLESLAGSRSGTKPKKPNWRSSGANERRQAQLPTADIMRLLRGGGFQE